MQTGLTAGDRKLLLGAAAVGLALVVGTVAVGGDVDQPVQETPSSYSNGPGGARAAFLWLKDLGYRVEHWEESPAALAQANRGSLLIIAAPTVPPTPAERRAIVQFVQQGGDLLFCGASLNEFFRDAQVSNQMYGASEQDFHAAFPSALARGAELIRMQPEAFWGKLSPAQIAIYGGGDT